MKANLIGVLALAAVASLSCSFSGIGSPEVLIIGEWEWIRSSGGFAGRTVTPDSSGYSSRQIYFTPTGSFSFYRADTLAGSGFYFLGRRQKALITKLCHIT